MRTYALTRPIRTQSLAIRAVKIHPLDRKKKAAVRRQLTSVSGVAATWRTLISTATNLPPSAVGELCRSDAWAIASIISNPKASHMNEQAAPGEWVNISRTLSYPITPANGGEPLLVVSLREPNVDALERVEALGMVEGEKPTLAQLRGIVAALSGMPDEVIKKLHHRDFGALVEVAVPLLVAGAGSDT